MSERQEKETGTYTGRRLRKGKLQHCFQGEDGGEFWFPKAKVSVFSGAKIGTTYDLTGPFPELWSARKLSTATEQDCIRWQVKDRAAYQTKTERAGSSSPELDQAVATLKVARAHLPKAQGNAFDAWLLNKIR